MKLDEIGKTLIDKRFILLMMINWIFETLNVNATRENSKYNTG